MIISIYSWEQYLLSDNNMRISLYDLDEININKVIKSDIRCANKIYQNILSVSSSVLNNIAYVRYINNNVYLEKNESISIHFYLNITDIIYTLIILFSRYRKVGIFKIKMKPSSSSLVIKDLNSILRNSKLFNVVETEYDIIININGSFYLRNFIQNNLA